jgi:hypothetical protein
VPSTFDDFFDAAWSDPDVVASLPIITSEIGDGWLYGVPSDPLKNAQFRALARHRRACLESGRCSPDAMDLKRFERLLVKVPEHTWGARRKFKVIFCCIRSWWRHLQKVTTRSKNS